jgi:hypothetical protein
MAAAGGRSELTRRIKTLAVAAVLAVTAAGCATTRPGGTSATPGNDYSGGSGSAGSCVPMLKFHHLVYEGTSLRTHPPYNHYGVIPLSRLHRIGVAVLPPCIDTNHPGIDDTPPQPSRWHGLMA